MRFLWALVVGLAATAFVPLIAVFIPYAWFHVYIHQIPLHPSHPHMKEALVSLRATCVATGCLLPPLSFIPFLCDPQAEANLAEVQSSSVLFRLTVDQGVFYDSITRNTPTTSDFSLLSELDNTADIALSYDSLFLLLQDGAREVSGVGDVLLLSNIQRTLRVALRAIYRVVLNVELSIVRLSFVQTIALSGLTTLEWAVSSFSSAGRDMPLRFDCWVKISSTSTSESIHWVRVELQSALSACSALQDSLAKLEASGVHCSLPTVDICAKTAPLLLGRQALEPLVARLMDLSAELDDWEKMLARYFDISGGAVDHLMAAIPILQTHQSGLREKMLRIQKLRLFVEALMGWD